MRLTLSNTLRTRPGNYTKDARLVNSYPDVKNGETVARKRPGCVPTGYDFTTIQGFSSIADLVGQLPYGEWGDISQLLFTIDGDSYLFTEILPPEPPGPNDYVPSFAYSPGDMIVITDSTAIAGETSAGQVWYAVMPIDPLDPRQRPNYNFNDARYPFRGQAWQWNTPPSFANLYRTYLALGPGGVDQTFGVYCPTIWGATYYTWCHAANTAPPGTGSKWYAYAGAGLKVLGNPASGCWAYIYEWDGATEDHFVGNFNRGGNY